MNAELQEHCMGGCIPSRIFIDQPSINNFVCAVCLQVCWNPVVDECGHVFGEKCIKKCVETRTTCPLSKQNYSSSLKFIPVLPVKNHIMQMKVTCPNQTCQWTNNFESLEKHLKECQEQLIKCPKEQCKEKFERKKLSNHIKKECDFELISCSFRQILGCKELIVDKFMLKHLVEKHPEELREAADNYMEPEKGMHFKNSTRNLEGLITPRKLRLESSQKDFFPVPRRIEEEKEYSFSRGKIKSGDERISSKKM